MSKLITSGKWFWGYLDDLGVVRVKPYTGDKIIQNTEQLPFCRGIFNPFTAESKHHAQMKIADFLTNERIKEAQKDSFTASFMTAPEEKQ
jgi:hypothetical protein